MHSLFAHKMSFDDNSSTSSTSSSSSTISTDHSVQTLCHPTPNGKKPILRTSRVRPAADQTPEAASAPSPAPSATTSSSPTSTPTTPPKVLLSTPKPSKGRKSGLPPELVHPLVEELIDKFKSVALAGSSDFNSPPFIKDCLAEYTTDPHTGERDPKKVKQVAWRAHQLKKLAKQDPKKFEEKRQLFKEDFERFEANQKKVVNFHIPTSSDTSLFSPVLEPPSTEDPPTMSAMLRTTRGNTRASSNPASTPAAATGKDLEINSSKLSCLH